MGVVERKKTRQEKSTILTMITYKRHDKTMYIARVKDPEVQWGGTDRMALRRRCVGA